MINRRINQQIVCLGILLVLSSGVGFAQQVIRESPPAFLLTEKDRVYIMIGKIPELTDGFMVYKKQDKLWQLLTEQPIKAINDPLEFRNFIGDDLYDWLKKATKGEDEYQVVRRILRDRNLIAAFSIVNTKLAEVLGRLFVDKDVTSGKEYTYKIVFLDIFDKEIVEFVKTITVKEARIPEPPFKASGQAGDSEIRVTWNYKELPVKGFDYTAVGFNIYRKEDGEFEKANKVLLLWQDDKTFWVDREVENGKKYQYFVTAVDLIGKESKPGNYTEIIALVDKTPPVMPEGGVIAPQEDRIVLAWKMNLELDLQGYNIYRGETLQEDAEFKKINKELLPCDFPYYEDKDVIPGKTYFYRIVAVDSSGNESKHTSAYSGLVKDTEPPASPKDVKFKYDIKTHMVEITWIGAKEEDLLGFNLYRGAGTDTAMKITQKPIKELLYKDEAYHKRWIIPGKGYYWGVSCVDNSFNESQKVWVKGDILDDEPPLSPKSIYARSQEDGKVEISWQICLSSDAAGYKLYRGETDKPLLLKQLGTDTLAYIDANVKKGKRYFYQVSAIDTGGNESGLSDKFYVISADIISPPTAKNLKAIYVEKQKYTMVTWDTVVVDDLAGYEVYTCDLPTGLYKKITDKLVIEEKFINKVGKEGLYYKIRAVDTSDNPSRYSDFAQAEKEKGK
ncbi:MAG: hypothetical protein V1749_04655 [Candidatus Desantisbacteria bacterium]